MSLLLLRAPAVFWNARSLTCEGCLWKEAACLNCHGVSRTGILYIQPKGGVGDCKSAPSVEGGRHECNPFRGTLSSTETSLLGMDSAQWTLYFYRVREGVGDPSPIVLSPFPVPGTLEGV